MIFRPNIAGSLFGIVLGGIPLLVIILFITEEQANDYFGVSKLVFSVTIIVIALLLAASFSFGARKAARQHSIKSLSFACLTMFGTSRALNSLEESRWLGGEYAFVTVILLKLFVAYILGWRFAALSALKLAPSRSKSDRCRKAVRVCFEAEIMNAAISLRTQVVVSGPKRCRVGKIKGIHSGGKPWFEIEYALADEMLINKLLDGRNEFSVVRIEAEERKDKRSQLIMPTGARSGLDG